MISGKKFIAIVPARIGSKRLKMKNLREFNGKPLFLWSMMSAKKSKYIDRIYLSTDSKKINTIAFKNGFKIYNLRSKKLSTDKTTSSELILNIFSRIKEKFDFFILLQPTSPLRQSTDIDYAIKRIVQKNKKSLVSVNAKNNRNNGAIYIQNISFFKKNKKFRYKNSMIYKMPAKKSIDIDTKKDFDQALKYCS
tara:strand:+ start:1193 stop:1774 length:582 start_codon:yes stop_codon:yes gene_type:complete